MASQGPLSPGTMADDATVGTATWTNPDNAKVSDNVYATAVVGSQADVTDSAAKIVKSDGSIGATNKKLTPVWNASDPNNYVAYGGISDLWGETWTGADINNSNFGFVLSAVGSDSISHYLKATNFGFSIPSDSIINGILVEVERFNSCFAVGTEISIPYGGFQKIEKIKIGDYIVSYNLKTQKNEITKVLKVFNHKVNEYIYLKTKRRTIKTTNEHPFLTKGGWRKVSDLSIGEELTATDGGDILIEKQIVKEETEVYNLEVENPHTYFANGFIVHNKISNTASVDHIRITVIYTQFDLSGNSTAWGLKII